MNWGGVNRCLRRKKKALTFRRHPWINCGSFDQASIAPILNLLSSGFISWSYLSCVLSSHYVHRTQPDNPFLAPIKTYHASLWLCLTLNCVYCLLMLQPSASMPPGLFGAFPLIPSTYHNRQCGFCESLYMTSFDDSLGLLNFDRGHQLLHGYWWMHFDQHFWNN